MRMSHFSTEAFVCAFSFMSHPHTDRHPQINNEKRADYVMSWSNVHRNIVFQKRTNKAENIRYTFFQLFK